MAAQGRKWFVLVCCNVAGQSDIQSRHWVDTRWAPDDPDRTMAARAACNMTSRAGAAAAAAKSAARDAAFVAVPSRSARCTHKEGRSGQPGSHLGVSAPSVTYNGLWRVQGDTGHSIVSEFASARARTLGAFGKNEVSRHPPFWPPLPCVPPLPPVPPAHVHRAHDPCQKADSAADAPGGCARHLKPARLHRRLLHPCVWDIAQAAAVSRGCGGLLVAAASVVRSTKRRHARHDAHARALHAHARLALALPCLTVHVWHDLVPGRLHGASAGKRQLQAPTGARPGPTLATYLAASRPSRRRRQHLRQIICATNRGKQKQREWT